MGAGKLPAIQFYPGDWKRDAGVQSLSYHDRGVWFEILMLMHESPIRGKLMLGTKAMSNAVLAGILNLSVESITETVETLIDRGVTEFDEKTKSLISRRMLRDEEDRANGRARAHKHYKSSKINGEANGLITGFSTPPSSSLSSSSSKNKSDAPSASVSGEFQLPEWISATAWAGWEEMRKKIRKGLTNYARALAVKKLDKLRAEGNDVTQLLEDATLGGWSSFYVKESSRLSGAKRSGPDPRIGRADENPSAQELERRRLVAEELERNIEGLERRNREREERERAAQSMAATATQD